MKADSFAQSYTNNKLWKLPHYNAVFPKLQECACIFWKFILHNCIVSLVQQEYPHPGAGIRRGTKSDCIKSVQEMDKCPHTVA